MLQKIGFFHFGAEDKGQPVRSLIRALEASISERGDRYLDDALIVLPEAFNIRTTYNKPERPAYDPGIKACLKVLAAEFKVVFVAGLVVEESVEQVLPFSSAYFLGAQTCKLLTRKRWGDQMDGRLYVACPTWPSVPYSYDDQTAIAALICMDAKKYRKASGTPESSNTEHDALRARMQVTGTQRNILCVPAHLGDSLDEIQESLVNVWSDKDLVIANSSVGKCISLVKLQNGVPEYEQEHVNKVVVKSLGQLHYLSTDTPS
jgi:hypothetical protein